MRMSARCALQFVAAWLSANFDDLLDIEITEYAVMAIVAGKLSE
jgi:hypothetical protein